MEIGTSMLARPRRREFHAERKNTWPANRAQGVAMIADSQYISTRALGCNS